MNNKERNCRIAYEALMILATIALLSFICRLWPIIILALVGTIVAALRLLFLKSKTESIVEQEKVEEAAKVPEMQDVYELAFALIQGQITKEACPGIRERSGYGKHRSRNRKLKTAKKSMFCSMVPAAIDVPRCASLRCV